MFRLLVSTLLFEESQELEPELFLLFYSLFKSMDGLLTFTIHHEKTCLFVLKLRNPLLLNLQLCLEATYLLLEKIVGRPGLFLQHRG